MVAAKTGLTVSNLTVTSPKTAVWAAGSNLECQGVLATAVIRGLNRLQAGWTQDAQRAEADDLLPLLRVPTNLGRAVIANPLGPPVHFSQYPRHYTNTCIFVNDHLAN